MVSTDKEFNVFTIDYGKVDDIANKDWSVIKTILEDLLKKEGSQNPSAEAEALIDEAKTRGRRIVIDMFRINAPDLADKIAKYIIAFAIVSEYQ